MDKVAIVILSWNGSQMLRSFLPSVLEYTEEEATVYVADNGSEDDTLEVLATSFPSVKVISLDKNYGFAEGYNRALQEVEAEYVVLLNSDVEVKDRWLTPLVVFMDAHPEVAACQPKIKSWREPKSFEYAGAAGGFLDCYGYPFCRGRIFNSVEEDHGQYDTPMKVFWATGACLFIRLQDYREAGGLDARFFAHMEEIDLCWRLNARGREVWCIPESTVYHVGAATLKRENPRKTFLNFRNNLLMLYKNLPDNELHRVMHGRTFFDYLAVLSLVLKGQFSNARAVFHARKAYHRLRPDFFISRNLNMLARVEHPAQTCWKKCLLLAYYVKRKHTFAKLF
ncbi:MAG: glycosyltransferase family 2 protein [Bacteroidaceae bacterium]|nr:glycosyltransferase family 2 protein [Bacteroidaceae bacterium]